MQATEAGAKSVANDRRAIVTYLVLTLALSAIFWTIMIRAGTLGVRGGLYVMLLMWCPGVAGMATHLIHHRTLRGLGWKWGSSRDQLISGVVWSVWHWPLLLFADYNAGTSALFGLAAFSAMVIGISFAMAWLRLHSGSLWTGAILHATHNLFIQDVFDRFTGDTGPTEWIIGEFGIGLAVVLVIVGWIAWRYRGSVQPAPLNER